jgi:hypothetical protein
MESVKGYFLRLREFIQTAPLPGNLARVDAQFMFGFDDGKSVQLGFNISPKPDGELPVSTDATPKEQ